MTIEINPDDITKAEGALRLHVGDLLFESGAKLFYDGLVGKLTITKKSIRATVATATEGACAVEIRRTPRGFEGHGTCPASDGFDFCEHCVAAALAAADRDTRRAQALDGTPEDRLQVFLDELPRERLIELIATAAHDLPDLNERLQLQADIATGALDTRAARKLVTAALPLRRVWQRAQVRRYFAKAVPAINGLVQAAKVMDSETLLNVAQYALDRYASVLERVDDSDGNRWFLQDRLRTLLAAALAKTDWSDEERAQYLLERVLRDQGDFFEKGLEGFETALGNGGRTAFYAAAQARLDDLNDESTEDDFFGLQRSQLISLLRDDAIDRDDIDALIDLEKRNLRGAMDRYRLTELYLRKPDLAAALEMLDEADQMAHPKNHNHALRVAVHKAREEWDKAVEAQVDLLLDEPSLSSYRELQALAGQANSTTRVIRGVTATLRKQLETGNPRRSVAADLLAQLAIESGKVDQAYALIVEHVSDAERLLDMSAWFQKEEPVRATQLIDCAVEATIAQKKNWAYKEIVKIIWSHRSVFDRLGPQAFAGFVANLKMRHKAKRNLVALLDAAGRE